MLAGVFWQIIDSEPPSAPTDGGAARVVCEPSPPASTDGGATAASDGDVHMLSTDATGDVVIADKQVSNYCVHQQHIGLRPSCTADRKQTTRDSMGIAPFPSEPPPQSTECTRVHVCARVFMFARAWIVCIYVCFWISCI